MENKNGNGVFLGVVAVATLIVAIIGATFAYFSATVNSDEGAVNLTAYQFDAAIASIEKVAPTTETGIIPLATGLLNQGIVGFESNGKCIDKNGKQVCVIYEATLANNGTSSVIFSAATLKTISNDFTRDNGSGTTITDLKAAYLGTGTSIPTAYIGTPVAVPVDSTAAAATIDLNNTTIEVPAATTNGDAKQAGTAKLYFVVYLEEPVTPVNGDTAIDQSAYMNGTYSGQLFLSTADGSRITGTFE